MNDGAMDRKTKRTLFLLKAESLCHLGFSYATQPVLITGLALLLGASTFQIGLLGSVNGFGYFSVILAPVLVRLAGGSRKKILLISSGIRSVAWLAIIGLVLLQPSGGMWWLILLLAAGRSSGNVNTPLSRAWISTVVPEKQRGRFLGARMAVSMIGATAVPPLVGFIADSIEGRTGLALAFSVGIFLGIGSVVLFSLSLDPGAGEGTSLSIWERLKSSLRHHGFRRLLLYHGVEALGHHSIGVFLNVFYLKYLHMTFFLVSFYLSISKVIKAFAGILSGRLIDRHRPLPVLKVSAILQATVTLILLLARPDTLWIVAVFLILQGVANAGTTLPVQSLTMAWGNPGDQTGDFALVSFVEGLMGTLGPFFSALLLKSLFDFNVELESIEALPIHALIIAGTAIRLFAILLLPHRSVDPSRRH